MDRKARLRHTDLMCLRHLTFLLAAAAPASASGVCVENASESEYIFVAHADDGPRRVSGLAPGGRLCSTGNGKGTVAVFVAIDDLEGCSRRIPANTTERLVLFPHVDLCTWDRVE